MMIRFIERYGTHVVVGVKMGGKEVLHIKQMQTSSLDPTQVQNSLKQLADQRFSADVNATTFSGGTQNQLQKKHQLKVKKHSFYCQNVTSLNFLPTYVSWWFILQKKNAHENIQGVYAVRPPIVILSKNNVSLLPLYIIYWFSTYSVHKMCMLL